MKPYLVVALTLATPALAQSGRFRQVPGQYPQIHHAIAAAFPGDVIFVGPGTYQPFVLDKALTITRATSTQPVVVGESRVESIPFGQVAAIEGIIFQSRPWPDPNPNAPPPDNHALILGPSQGTVMLRICSVNTGVVTAATAGRLRPLSALLIDDCPAILDALTCAGRSGAHGMLISQTPGIVAPVVMNGGTATGGHADAGFWVTEDLFMPGSGIVVVDNQGVYLNGISAFGGMVQGVNPFPQNSTPAWKGGAGLLVEDGIVFARNCSFQGGRGGTHAGHEGGDGLHALGTAQVHEESSNFVAGAAGGPSGIAGQQAFPGPPMPRALAALALTPVSNLVFQSSITVRVNAHQNDAFVLYVSPNFLPVQIPGVLEPAFFGTPMIAFATLFLQQGNFAQLSFLIQQPDPNLIGVPILFQAVGYGQGPLMVAAPTASFFK